MNDVKLPKRITELVRLGSREADEKNAALKEHGKKILHLSAYPDRKVPREIIDEAICELDVLEHPPARRAAGVN